LGCGWTRQGENQRVILEKASERIGKKMARGKRKGHWKGGGGITSNLLSSASKRK